MVMIVYILSTRTSVRPNIPSTLTFLLSQFRNLFTGQTLIIAIIPFTDGLGDFDFCVCANWFGFFVLSLRCPWETFATA